MSRRGKFIETERCKWFLEIEGAKNGEQLLMFLSGVIKRMRSRISVNNSFIIL